MNKIFVGERKAISNWVRQFKTVINFEKGEYKLQEGLLGVLKWGETKPLPKIDYVLVFKTLFAKCEACSIDALENNPNSYYQISVVHNKTRRIFVHETKNKNEALNLAKPLASGLKVRLKDSASNPKQSVWVV